MNRTVPERTCGVRVRDSDRRGGSVATDCTDGTGLSHQREIIPGVPALTLSIGSPIPTVPGSGRCINRSKRGSNPDWPFCPRADFLLVYSEGMSDPLPVVVGIDGGATYSFGVAVDFSGQALAAAK